MQSPSIRSPSRCASFSVLEDDAGRPPNRTFSWSCATSADNLTFSLTLSASQSANMHLANCLSSIPLTEGTSRPGSKPGSPCRSLHPRELAKVRRTFQLSIARPPAKAWRWVKGCSLLFWLTTAAAAMVVAHAAARHARGAPRASVLSHDRRGPHALDFFQGAAQHGAGVAAPASLLSLGPDLLSAARYGLAEVLPAAPCSCTKVCNTLHLNLQPHVLPACNPMCSKVGDELRGGIAEGGRRHTDAVAAQRAQALAQIRQAEASIRTLRIHLSPLGYSPVHLAPLGYPDPSLSFEGGDAATAAAAAAAAAVPHIPQAHAA